jgi:hypothetical protein
MMKRGALMIGLLLAACSQSTGPATGVASTARQSPSPAATATTRVVVAVSQLPLTTVDFSCRLPVVVGDAGGFITFPGGNFIADPNGTLRQQPSGTYAIDGSPKLYGVTWQMYDVAERRWVPTDPDHMTPDGRFYAYAIGNSVHVVDVASGADTVSVVALPGAEAQNARVADFNSAGVYLLADQFNKYPSGVWLMNQTNGDIRALQLMSGVMAVRDGLAWIGLVDPRDPSPPRLTSGDLTFDSIARLDLASGIQTLWFYRPGEAVSLLGLDGRDRPVVGLATNASFDFNRVSEVRFVERPGDAGTLIFSGGWGLQGPQRDGDRMWFGGASGIYLYTARHSLQNVSTVGGLPVGRCF